MTGNRTRNDKAQAATTMYTMPNPPGARDDTADQDGVPPDVRRELSNLYKDTSSSGASYLLRITDIVKRDDSPLTAGGYVDVQLDEEHESDPRPMLVLLPIDEDERAAAINPRKVTGSTDLSLSVRIPTDLLAGTQYDRGLDLDLGRYDNDNQLLFEPLLDEDVVGFVPVLWDSGERYERAPPVGTRRDAAQEAVAPPTGVVSPSAIDDASQVTGVERDRVVDAVANAARSVDESALRAAGVVSDAYDPLQHDDAVLLVLEPDAWDVLADDVDADVRDAVALAFLNEARRIVQVAGAKEYRRFSRDHAAIVLPAEGVQTDE